MSFVVLDTDAASLLQRGRLESAQARHLAGRTLALTFVTIGELHKGMVLRNWGARRRADLEAWIEGFLVLPVLRGGCTLRPYHFAVTRRLPGAADGHRDGWSTLALRAALTLR